MRSCARQSPDEAVAAEPGGGAKFAYVFSCVLITAGLVTSVVGHPPLVGGAGYADYFDRHRADIVTMHWVDPPADGLTVEAWVYISDVHNTPALFSYAVYDSSVDPPYEQANELVLLMTSEQQVFFRATATSRCNDIDEAGKASMQSCGLLVNPNNTWVHVAVSWDRASGVVSFFADGELLFQSERAVEGDLLRPPRAGGVLVIGQEMDAFLGDFDDMQSLDGIVDELRLWVRPLSAEEIQTNMHRVLRVGQHNTTGLHMLWQFDRFDAAVEEDLSGNGHDGLRGSTPSLKNELVYLTARGITRPTTPLRVASRAPVFGGPLVLFANADAATPLKLPARDPAGRELTVHIETLPSAGSLTTIDGRELTAEVNNVPGHGVDNEFQVMYQLSSICQGDDIVDTFSYSAIAFGGESATGSVIVHCLELQSPDSRRLTNPSFVKSLEILEDTPAVLNLGAVGRNGEPLAVEITGLPDRGQLYQIEFAGENDYTYAAVVYPGSQPISQVGTRVSSSRGLIVYVPERDAAYESSVKYVHVLGGSGLATPEGEHRIVVTPVNDPPELVAAPLSTVEDMQAVEITLAAEDGDASFPGARTEYTIVRWPVLGELYQEGGGQPIEEVFRVPKVAQWAVRIPPYSVSWGPSFSSQYSMCSCCLIQQTCPHNCSCSVLSWHATQALGEPDAYPAYGDSTLGWEPTPENGGKEFVTLEYLDPVYVSKVSIYEVYNPGSVWRISAAAEYAGNETKWSVLWAGDPDPSARKEVRVFYPPLCSDVSQKAKFIRLDVDSSAVPGWQVIDAVNLEGSFEYPPGRVSSKAGKVVYMPTPGVHVTGQRNDSFLVTVGDCLDKSTPFELHVAPVAPPQEAAFTTFRPPQVLEVPLFEMAPVEINVDIHQAREHALSALAVLAPGQVAGQTYVQVLPHGELHEAGILVTLADGELELPWAETSALADPQENSFLLVPPSASGWTEHHNKTLRVWAHTDGIVHRLEIQLKPACRPGSLAPACSTDPCLGQPGKTWSEEKKQCVGQSSVLLPVVIAAVCVAFLLFAGVALLLLRQRHLHRYVKALEHAAMAGSESPISFESPIMLAVNALKEIGSVRFVSKELRHSALKAWQLLLKQDNLYAPAISDDSSDDGGNAGQRNEMKEAARLIVDFVAQGNNHVALDWHTESERSSKSSAILANIGDADLDSVRAPLEMLSQLKTSDQAEYMKTVGTNLLLDSFHLTKITANRPLFTAGMMALKHHNLIADLRINEDAVARFLIKVEDGYQDVPYHNRTHAADVVSRLSAMLMVDGCIGRDGSIASQCTLYAAILAAAIHDYGHPGTDNNFQVASKTDVARRWNHQGVLENHSLHECLEMLRTPGMDALSGTKGNCDAIIATIIKMVLATDMVNHFSIMGDFNGKVVSQVEQSSSSGARNTEKAMDARRSWFQSLDDNTKALVLTVAIKVADIGHSLTTWEAHISWSQRLQDEFFMQGHKELEAGREPGILKHPHKPGVMSPSNQGSFFDYIALPLVKAWAEVFPTSGGILFEQGRSNRAKWLQKKEDANKANAIKVDVEATAASQTFNQRLGGYRK